MDKSERETRDFMNVESFSQLPFIRPGPPVKEKAGGAIRLFGKEFGAKSTTTTSTATTGDDHHSDENNNNNNANQEQGEASKDSTNSDNSTDQINSRKFECHYCCRNFPTSQALGGHQNAHKRERQHAKRAHLQGLSDAHVYGLMNYTRLSSAPALPMAYPSWSSGSSHYGASTRLYGSSHASYNNAHQPQPINGSPLALWRIPGTHSSSVFSTHDQRSMHSQIVPSFSIKNNDHHLKPLSSISRGLSSAQSRFAYEPNASMQDHVSLDLHL